MLSFSSNILIFLVSWFLRVFMFSIIWFYPIPQNPDSSCIITVTTYSWFHLWKSKELIEYWVQKRHRSSSCEFREILFLASCCFHCWGSWKFIEGETRILAASIEDVSKGTKHFKKEAFGRFQLELNQFGLLSYTNANIKQLVDVREDECFRIWVRRLRWQLQIKRCCRCQDGEEHCVKLYLLVDPLEFLRFNSLLQDVTTILFPRNTTFPTKIEPTYSDNKPGVDASIWGWENQDQRKQLVGKFELSAISPASCGVS